jgi:hypothetical protein
MNSEELSDFTPLSEVIWEMSGRAFNGLYNTLCPSHEYLEGDEGQRGHWVPVAKRRSLDEVSIGEVRRMSDAEILRIPNVGRLTLREIRAKIGRAAATPEDAPIEIRCPHCGALLWAK